MDNVGVLVVSYGAREAAMVDALSRSQNYKVKLFIADKQCNPFNVQKAEKHVVIPDLAIDTICKFAETHKDQIDFALVGPDKPIIDGIRDRLDQRAQKPSRSETRQANCGKRCRRLGRPFQQTGTAIRTLLIKLPIWHRY